MLNLIEQEEGNMLESTGTGKDFLNNTPIVKALTLRINEWDLMKLKNFCIAKDANSQIEAAYRMGKNHCQLHFWQTANN